MIVLIIGLMAYPYLTKYLSKSTQGKISTMENQVNFIKKLSKAIVNQKIDKKHDDFKDKEIIQQY
ncbi:MAG: hypothetical protein ACJAZX_000151 [Rickettsiales bacterium]|jgi:hypothetical protein